MSMTCGIEKMRLYPTTLSLDIADLCAARGFDADYARNDLLTDQRGVNPPWEDPVTMAVNAAAPMLDAEDRAAIGLLVVGTETGLDQEKPLSSWIHRHLGLSPHCRNFEVKFACYGATAGLSMALNWLASPEGAGRKALVISTDRSLTAFGEVYEPMLGAGAVAVLLSAQPRLFAYDWGRSGLYTQDVTDVIRPTPGIEVMNEESIYSYLDALDGAYQHYVEQVDPDLNFDAAFARNIYHVPFGGMSYRAHRTLLQTNGVCARRDMDAHYARKVLPSIAYTRRIGSPYGASTFMCLLALLARDEAVDDGDRVGIFAFGSGYSGEFYSGRVLAGARAEARRADADALLDARRPVTVAEYEACERAHTEATGCADHTPDRSLLGDWYERAYAGQRKLVLEQVENHHRHYAWS